MWPRRAWLRGGQQSSVRPHPMWRCSIRSAHPRPAFSAGGELPLHGAEPCRTTCSTWSAAAACWRSRVGSGCRPRDAPQAVRRGGGGLERSGVADPASRLALVRSWQTSTLLVKNGAFSQRGRRRRSKAFCNERSFDVAFYPGMKPRKRTALQRGRAARPVRRCNGAAGSRERRIPAELRSTSPRPPTTGRIFFHFR